MIPVGAVVRIRKSSKWYAPYRPKGHGNQPTMGVVFHDHAGGFGGYRYSVKWLNGYTNGYRHSDIEIWLGFTVEE